jgi:biotin transporter BioY
MSGDRAMSIFNVAVVLGLAAYASRERLDMGIAVAVVGLAAVYTWGVFGLIAAGGMTAAVLLLSGVAAVFVMALVAIVLVFVLFDAGPDPPRRRWGGPGYD